MSTEKTRNLMLKNSSLASSSQAVNLAPLSVFRGTSMRTALETANHPTGFAASTSEFDNAIIVTCPLVLTNQQEKSDNKDGKSVEPTPTVQNSSNISQPIHKLTAPGLIHPDTNTTCFVPLFDTIANNPFIVTCPAITD